MAGRQGGPDEKRHRGDSFSPVEFHQFLRFERNSAVVVSPARERRRAGSGQSCSVQNKTRN
jgi:hypothetical protein